MRRRARLPLAATAALVALTACGGPPTAGDMAERAEEYIEEDLAGNPEAGGITFQATECQDPASTEPNTAFVCTATGSDGQTYTFTVTIVGRNSLELVSQPPLPGRATDTTTPGSVPAGSASTTTAPAATTTTVAGG